MRAICLYHDWRRKTETRTRHHESSGADRLAKEPDSHFLEPL